MANVLSVDVLLALLIVGVMGWIVNRYAGRDVALRTTLSIALGLVIVGMLLWLINTYVPMARSIKAILNVVIVIAPCVRVLQVVGLWDGAVRMWTDFRAHRISR